VAAHPTAANSSVLSTALARTNAVIAAETKIHRKISSTPLLLLSVQVWLDEHGIKADLNDRFGKALQQLNSQLASIVNNALDVALQAGNLLLSTVLTLIISIYFVADGARLIAWLVGLVPPESRDQAKFFVDRLDSILGSYLRTQVILAFVAAVLASIGALVLGVPYAVVIFFSSFLLSLIPVIGPVVLPIPPLIVALIFTSVPTAIIYLIWLLIAEQIVTNVIGPRVQGQSVGIHPLEAMAAALLGLPIAGFLGAFLAVPIVAFLHVVVQEILHARKSSSPPGGEPPPQRSDVPPAASSTDVLASGKHP
jgi:predicted PurR-regulated permease PerM